MKIQKRIQNPKLDQNPKMDHNPKKNDQENGSDQAWIKILNWFKIQKNSSKIPKWIKIRNSRTTLYIFLTNRKKGLPESS